MRGEKRSWIERRKEIGRRKKKFIYVKIKYIKNILYV